MLENRNENELDDIEMTGEDNVDEPALEHIEELGQDKLKALREKLKVCESEKMQYLEDLQRAKAEFLNSKKRVEDQRIQDKERAVETQIEKLLPLCDSFDMAMQNTEAWEAIDANWRSGIEGIYTQLISILDSYGVTKHSEINEAFDPEKHEAVGTKDSDQETDTVTEVLQAGYSRNGNNIRVAKVILST